MRLLPVRPVRAARTLHRSTLLLAVLVGAAMPASGCGTAAAPAPRPTVEPGLAAGRRGTEPHGVGGAWRLAHRFAEAYAARAYGRRPPHISRETGQVGHALATRVPRALRRLRTELQRLRISLRPGGAFGATEEIRARRRPAFSVAFSVARRQGRWMVTSISLPD